MREEVRVLIRENHTSPLVALRAVALGGLRSETDATAGITNLMRTLLPKGTARWTAAELAEVVEARGGSLSAFGGNNSWGVNVDMLSSDWRLAADVLDEVCVAFTYASRPSLEAYLTFLQ